MNARAKGGVKGRGGGGIGQAFVQIFLRRFVDIDLDMPHAVPDDSNDDEGDERKGHSPLCCQCGRSNWQQTILKLWPTCFAAPSLCTAQSLKFGDKGGVIGPWMNANDGGGGL